MAIMTEIRTLSSILKRANTAVTAAGAESAKKAYIVDAEL